MKLLEHLNEALKYIEENLSNEVDFKEAARREWCSEYHFMRMFSFLAGISLSEYIRRRRRIRFKRFGGGYIQWFPSSQYEQIEGPELLWNESKDVTSPTFKSEIWIPVAKK